MDSRATSAFKPYRTFNPVSPEWSGITYQDLVKPLFSADESAIVEHISSTLTSVSTAFTFGSTVYFQDGSAAAPSITFQNDVDSGWYRIGSNNIGATLNGALVYDWNVTRLKLASGLSLDITDMTLGSVLFAGTGGRVSQDNTNLFWDDTNDRLGVGCNDPFRALEVRSASLPQLVLSQDADNAVLFQGSVNGLVITGYNTNFGELAFVSAQGRVNTDIELSAYNTRTSGSGAGARVGVQAGDPAAGDAYYYASISGGSTWVWGIDNSDADAWKLALGTTLNPLDATVYLTTTTSGYATWTPGVRASGTDWGFRITGPVNTGGSNGLFRLTNGASTGQTASTEINFVKIDLSSTVTWATGAISDERALQILAPTLAFAGASTVTRAATLYIDRAPQAGSNATITNAYAIWVDDGTCRFDGGITFGSFTQGSVLFAGSGGVLSQDNTAFFWDDTNDFLQLTGTAGKQLRLAYDGSNYGDITVSAAGELQFDSSSNYTLFADTITVTGVETGQGASLTLSPTALSSGSKHVLAINGAANTGGAIGLINAVGGSATGQTASTEIVMYRFLPGTITWATGALADERCFSIFAPTLAFAGASTVTRAATLYIDRAPQAGSNATLSNSYAVWIDAGAVRIDDWVNIGTATDAAAQGDLASGLTGAARMFYDQSVPTLTFYNSSGTVVNLISSVASTATVWNEQGADIDFRVEGDTNASLVFVDASADKVGIAAAPNTSFGVFQVLKQGAHGSESGGAIYAVNDATSPNKFVMIGYDNTIDAGFINAIHSATANKPLILNSQAGNVGIGTTGPDAKLDILDAGGGAQLRLTYTDGSVYAELQATSGGILKLIPSGNDLSFEKAASGATLFFNFGNTSNTASSRAAMYGYVGGSSAGDPYIRLDVLGVTQWSLGVDNDDSDKFKICGASAPVGNDWLTITTLGGTTLASDTTLAAQLLTLDQNDTDQSFIDFQGNSAGDATASISTFTTGNSIQGFVQVEINGTKRWIPFYDDPTS